MLQSTSRSELGRLREGQVLDGIDLTLAEASALNASKLVSVTPGAGGWQVTAVYAVGALNVGGLVVRVTPKIGSVQVLRLLARAHGVRHLDLDDAHVNVDDDCDLGVVLAALFAQEARRALAAGPLRGYRTEDQTLSVVRGRLRVRDQELRRFGMLVPIEVTVDEWTTDTDENRRILAATRRLSTLPGLLDSTRRVLLHVDRLLSDVRLPPPGHALPPWRPTRLTCRLHRLLRLADLVLSGANVEHRAGDVEAHGFVVPMEKLFEDLVARMLSELDDEAQLAAQSTYALDTLGRMTIKPDLVLRSGGRDVAVADTKYKVLDDKGKLRNDDGYQLLAYCTRLGLDVGHLVYASGSLPTEPYVLEGSAVTLQIHKVDMGQSVEDIERAVADLRRRLLGCYEDAAATC
jgi:5-methylcytosine-specific restriction enzyme subunit McrC